MGIVDGVGKLWASITRASATPSGHGRSSPFGVDVARLYSLNTVDRQRADKAEKALENGQFAHHGDMPDGSHLVSFANGGVPYVAIIEVQTVENLGSALIVSAVYQQEQDSILTYIEKLRRSDRTS
jgi:hypothetical protein